MILLAVVMALPTAMVPVASHGAAPAGSAPHISGIPLAIAATSGLGDRPATGAPVGVPVDTNVSTGVVGTGGFPYGADYDPANQELYVANYGTGNVTVVNATTGQHVADVAMTSNPTGVAYVPWNNEVYVSVEGSATIEVINPTNNTVNATIPLAGEPENIAYDSANHILYATVWTKSATPIGLQAVYTSNNTAAPAVRAGFNEAYELAVDPSNDTVWVENLGNDTITVFSGSTNTVVGWVHPGPQPHGATLQGGIVYSPVGDQVFVVNYATVGTVNIFGASNYTLLHSGIPVGGGAFGASATYDAASQRVYVASYEANTVTVISAVNDSVAAPTISVPGGPWVGVYDPTTGALFFLLSVTNGAAWIFGGIAVEFSEIGLPVGSSWSVSAAGAVQSTAHPIISFAEPVGSGRYSVVSELGYQAANQSGMFAVPSTPVTPLALAFAFLPPTYPVQFTEQGLPSGASWSVIVNASAPVVGTAESPVTVFEPNGTYPFVVRSATTDYRPIVNASGFVVVAGGASVSVTFRAVTFAIAFTESGLPTGQSWSVTIGTASTHGAVPTMVVNETNGTYTFRVGEIAGYTASPSEGPVTVAGANVPEAIAFSVTVYDVSFSETGLPSGTSWSVSLDGIPQSGTGTITFLRIANGSYSYAVGAVAGYSASPQRGNLSVNGHPATETIAFSSNAPPSSNSSSGSTFLGLPAFEGYSVLGGLLVAILIVVLAVVLWARKGKQPPAAASSPPPPDDAPPGPA